MNNTQRYRSACGRIRASDEWKRKTADRMEQALRRPGKRPRLPKWAWTPAAAVLLAGILLFSPILNPATVRAKDNLMEGVSAQKQEILEAPDADFVAAQADFAVKLLQKAAAKDKNALISPVSVALALGMTANGAKGNTLSQFEALLGGGMDLQTLDRNLASEQEILKSPAEGKALLANSVWYRDKNLTVERPFLQANADFFNAGAFRLDFSDPASPKKINAWVEKNTDGKIKNMLENIDPSAVMYLINTLYLEQDWEVPYRDSRESVFHAPGGDRTVRMMGSMETWLHGENAEGILKPLKDPRYAFAAILPEEGTGPSEYLAGLTGGKLTDLLRSAGKERASASLPKFKFDCDLNLNKALISLGLSDAFDGSKADFSAMGSSNDGNLFIGNVLHKTFIEVDELGIKAGAATAVEMLAGAARPDRYVVFDRPFVIAVVDTETTLPVFLGVVADPAA